MAVINPPWALSGETHPAATARRLTGDIVHREGLANAEEWNVTNGGGMSVDVGAGAAFILGTEATRQGMYRVESDSTVNLAISAADSTNDRIDLVALYIRDADYSGADSDAVLGIVEGTAAPSPVAPTAPDTSIILAEVTVPAGAVAISLGDILDVRPDQIPHGVTPVSELPASVAEGEVVVHSGRLKLRNGGSWTTMATSTDVTTATPAGTVSMFFGTSAPSGWLICNGQAITSCDTLYPDLWAAAPSASKTGTTLLLPDFGSRFPMGATGTAGTEGGSSSVSITTANLPAHNHDMGHDHPSATTGNDGNHFHTGLSTRDQLINRNLSSLPSDGAWQVWEGSVSDTTASAASHNHTFNVPAYSGNTGNTGSNTALSLPLPPHVQMLFIVKT